MYVELTVGKQSKTIDAVTEHDIPSVAEKLEDMFFEVRDYIPHDKQLETVIRNGYNMMTGEIRRARVNGYKFKIIGEGVKVTDKERDKGKKLEILFKDYAEDKV